MTVLIINAPPLDDGYECAMCSARPGAPTLCVDCLRRRALLGKAWKGPRRTSTHPICERCTRNARTVDNPSVYVRVERCLVWRDGPTCQLLVRCHGVHLGPITVPESCDEMWIENLVVFR